MPPTVSADLSRAVLSYRGFFVNDEDLLYGMGLWRRAD